MFKLVDLHSFITEIIIEGENSTFTDTLEALADKYYWSRSVSNFSGKLSRESLRYTEAVELADVLGYDIVWVKRKDIIRKAGEKCEFKNRKACERKRKICRKGFECKIEYPEMGASHCRAGQEDKGSEK